MYDLIGVAAKERHRQLLAEAAHYRLVAAAREERRRGRGRHRTPFSLRALGRSAGTTARRGVTAVRQLGRDLSTGANHDPALPQLRDYPIAQNLTPRH